MILLEEIGLKQVHWECNPKALETGEPLAPTHEMIYRRSVKPSTSISNGFMVRYTIRMPTTNLMLLACIYEDVYISEDVLQMPFEQAKNILIHSFNKFHDDFQASAKTEGLYPSVDYSVKDKDVSLLLEQLRK